jgi:hypothetical protein
MTRAGRELYSARRTSDNPLECGHVFANDGEESCGKTVFDSTVTLALQIERWEDASRRVDMWLNYSR